MSTVLTLAHLKNFQTDIKITADNDVMEALRKKDTKTEWFYIKFNYNGNKKLESATIYQVSRGSNVVWAFKSFCRTVASFFSIFGFGVTSRSALINQVKQLSKDENVKKSTVDKELIKNVHTPRIKSILHKMALHSEMVRLKDKTLNLESQYSQLQNKDTDEAKQVKSDIDSNNTEITNLQSQLNSIQV